LLFIADRNKMEEQESISSVRS